MERRQLQHLDLARERLRHHQPDARRVVLRLGDVRLECGELARLQAVLVRRERRLRLGVQRQRFRLVLAYAGRVLLEVRLPDDRLRRPVPRRDVEVGGRPVQLTYVEFELLRTLATSPGRVFTRELLLQALWGGSDYREPRTIDVHVRHLREKLEQDPSEPEFILTVRGVGYRFRP